MFEREENSSATESGKPMQWAGGREGWEKYNKKHFWAVLRRRMSRGEDTWLATKAHYICRKMHSETWSGTNQVRPMESRRALVLAKFRCAPRGNRWNVETKTSRTAREVGRITGRRNPQNLRRDERHRYLKGQKVLGALAEIKTGLRVSEVNSSSAEKQDSR